MVDKGHEVKDQEHHEKRDYCLPVRSQIPDKHNYQRQQEAES
jgi:hypothetical protein